MSRFLRSFAAVSLLAAACLPASVQGADRPPKVAEVDYFKEKGAQGPDTELLVFGRRIDSMKFKASFAGDTATATGSEFTHVDSHRYGHPWIPDHDGGRRALLNAIKQSIAATGAATLKVIAKNDAGTTKEAVPIVLSECDQDPPIYPFTCTIKL